MNWNVKIAIAGAALLILSMPATSQSPGSNSDQGSLPDACRRIGDGMMQGGQGRMMQGGQGGMMGGGMMHGQGGMMGSTAGQSANGPMAAFGKEYMNAMAKMDGPMMMAFTSDDPDLAFTCAMIPHHQNAVDMAKIQLKYGKDAEAKKMAEQVIKEQEAEIADLKKMADRLGSQKR